MIGVFAGLLRLLDSHLQLAISTEQFEAPPVYWWLYQVRFSGIVPIQHLATSPLFLVQNTDAENLDIEQAPCGASCTLAQLETYCLALPTCVAFNTHGWLKYSTADMAPDSCDLYIKKDTPQPSPTPSPSPPPPPKIWFWPQPISANMGPSNITGAWRWRASVTILPAMCLVSLQCRPP
jgi:hypothetical protein